MIYMNSCAIKIVEARIIPIWSLKKSGKLTHLYKKPRNAGPWVGISMSNSTAYKNKRTWAQDIAELAVWHFKAVYDEDSTQVCDGKWIHSSVLRSDNGWPEIEECFTNLNLSDFQNYGEWCYSGGTLWKKPIETVFSPVEEKMVA